MAKQEDKNQQPVRESQIQKTTRDDTASFAEQSRKNEVTNTMPAPKNPFNNNEKPKEK